MNVNKVNSILISSQSKCEKISNSLPVPARDSCGVWLSLVRNWIFAISSTKNEYDLLKTITWSIYSKKSRDLYAKLPGDFFSPNIWYQYQLWQSLEREWEIYPSVLTFSATNRCFDFDHIVSFALQTTTRKCTKMWSALVERKHSLFLFFVLFTLPYGVMGTLKDCEVVNLGCSLLFFSIWK